MSEYSSSLSIDDEDVVGATCVRDADSVVSKKSSLNHSDAESILSAADDEEDVKLIVGP